MAGLVTSEYGIVGRSLPQPTPDGIEREQRLGRYGSVIAELLSATKHGLADEGAYFVATNATPGTAQAYNIQASFSDTTPFMYLFNKDQPANSANKRIYLDYVKIIVTTAAATGTQAYYAVKADAARAITTNNTATITAVNSNMDSGTQSIATLNAQNSGTASVIAAASSSARIVARGGFGGITIVGDELVMMFGTCDPGAYPGLTAAQATAPGRKVSVSPPIILGPQQSATIQLWFPGNATTGLSYEFEAGWWER